MQSLGLAKRSAHALDARGGCDVTMAAKVNLDRLGVHCKKEIVGTIFGPQAGDGLRDNGSQQ